MASVIRYKPIAGVRLLGGREGAGLVFLLLMPVLGAIFLFSHLAYLTLLNVAMILVGVPMAIATWRLIVSGGTDVEVTPTHLRTIRKVGIVHEIDLHEVVRIDFNDPTSRTWMMVRH